jgi:hypothetical protein
MLYLRTELDGAESADSELPALCLVTVCWNKSQETETLLVKWVNVKGQNPRCDCTVSSHIRSFVNTTVQIVGRFEGPSQLNFIVLVFSVYCFHLYKEQLQCCCLTTLPHCN